MTHRSFFPAVVTGKFSLIQLLLPLAMAASLPSPALGHGGSVIIECQSTGLGGDNGAFRGMRFSLDQGFASIEVGLDGSAAGTYVFDAELRRSSGFLAPVEAVSAVAVDLPGTPSVVPYPTVHIDFPTIPVTSGLETFTLKFLNISGPGALYIEVAGIGNFPCPGIEVTEENNVANPTPRTSPTNFRVLTPEIGSTKYCFGDGTSTSCPCGNSNNGSEGGCDWGNPAFPEGGVLDATGSSSMAAADTFLVATGIENDFGIFFGANNRVNGGNGNPLNDGLRCAGGGLVRLIPPTAASGNQATLPMPLQTLDSGAASGVTRRYQYWFRTPGGPCGQTANLTNGLEIVWLP